MPFPKHTPAYFAGVTRYSDQLKGPGGMGFGRDISRNRTLSDGYEQPTNFGHYMKRRKEVGQKCADSRLSSNRFLQGVASHRNVVSVKRIEDLKIFLVALANFCLGDGLVQGSFQTLKTCVPVASEAVG